MLIVSATPMAMADDHLVQALAQQPQVLLLDEPTAHLELQYQVELLALVRRLAQHDDIVSDGM